jgi:hypothetical protein
MTYDGALVMPRNCVAISSDEMTYIEGGDVYISNSTVKGFVSSAILVISSSSQIAAIGIAAFTARLAAGVAGLAARLGAFSPLLGLAFAIIGVSSILSLNKTIFEALISGKGINFAVKKTAGGIPYGISAGVK